MYNGGMRDNRVSLCMIVKNEASNLDQCLASVRNHVDEIVVVDTGSTDRTPDIARKYADRFEVYTECNEPNGLISSFSKARNRSFDLATMPWRMWLDGDDVVQGAQNIRKLVTQYSDGSSNPAIIMLPYEYSHDDAGNPICNLYRERIISPWEKFHWVSPIHEVLIAKDGSPRTVMSDEVKVIHRRHEVKTPNDPHRNFRILKSFVEGEGKGDPRQLFYLGREYGAIGDVKNAIKTLSEYVEVSGWDDEKCIACLDIASYYIGMGEYDKAITWGLCAIAIFENWGECWFVLAKCYYFKAQRGDDPQRNWRKCVYYAKQGLGCPPTQTVLFVNPVDRELEIYRYLNIALNALGDVKGALEAVEKGLKFKSTDPQLICNRKVYTEHLAKQVIREQLDKMKDVQAIDDSGARNVQIVLEGKNSAVPQTHGYHRPPNFPRDIKESDFPVAGRGAHAQAWVIPEEYIHDDLPVVMSDAQLQSAVGLIWKEFMWHDELMSAKVFLENAPFRVRHSATTENLLRLTRKMFDWMDTLESYDFGNATKKPDGTIQDHVQCPLDYELVGQVKYRWKFMNDRITKFNASIADMGCIDGEMSNRWGLMGYEVVGIDVCQNSVNLANEVAQQRKTGAKHVRCYFKDAPDVLQGKKFDYITCGDVYEHMVDPVEDLLRPARKLARDDGSMLMTTPYGGWFRGKFVPYGHPWMWSIREGLSWVTPDKVHNHIIAPTVWTVADHYRSAGWWVKDCMSVPQGIQDVPGQGNVCVWAKATAPNQDGPDVVIWTGPGWEKWCPTTVDAVGIGGSEMAAITMARLLVERGCRVRVYSDCGVYGEGVYDGVEYRIHEKFHDLDCDVLVVSRNCMALSPDIRVRAKVKYMWTHDVYPMSASHELISHASRILALSQWHKGNILNYLPYVQEDQITVTRNGIEFDRFDKYVDFPRNPHKVVCSSSFDRYLLSLLQMWPRIRERVNDAELHLFYGFYNWEKASAGNTEQLALIEKLKGMVASLKDQGVVMHGRVNQDTLAREFMTAGVWLYPTWFSETSCITAMEAQYAGLPAITSTIAALNETVGSMGTRIEGDWLSQSYQDKFIAAAVTALLDTSEEHRRQLREDARKRFPWSAVADSWVEMFKQDMSVPPVVRYKNPNMKEG